MRFWLVVLAAGLFLPHTSMAYEVVRHDLTTPYEVLSLSGSPEVQRLVVGELDGYPEMIEVTSDTEFTLTLNLRSVPSSTLPTFGAIVVRVVEPRGVEEVVRLKPQDADWDLVRDPLSKLRYQAGALYEETMASGTYRVEISTPDNFGQYMVMVGREEGEGGYFASWRSVAKLYEFYGVSKLGMLFTPLVFYPLGIILLLIGFGYTLYRTRDRLPFLNK
jgi:hypothetical protein